MRIPANKHWHRRYLHRIWLPKVELAGLDPVNVKFPYTNSISRTDPVGIVHFREQTRSASRRWNIAVQIGGQHSSHIYIYSRQIKINHCSRQSRQHPFALKCVNPGASPGSTLKLVYSHVIGIRPDAEFWIIIHFRSVNFKLVPVPCPGRDRHFVILQYIDNKVRCTPHLVLQTGSSANVWLRDQTG